MTLKEFLDREDKFAPIFLRIGLSLVWLWFGYSQLFHPEDFLQWVPKSITFVSPMTIVLLNGAAETILGLFLLIGFLTRISSFILAAHLTCIIIFIVGYNAIAMRNVGITIGNIVVFLDGHDKWTLDFLLLQSESKTFFGKLLRKLIL